MFEQIFVQLRNFFCRVAKIINWYLNDSFHRFFSKQFVFASYLVFIQETNEVKTLIIFFLSYKIINVSSSIVIILCLIRINNAIFTILFAYAIILFWDIIERNVRCFRKVIAIKVNELCTFSSINAQLFKRNAYKIIVETNFNSRYNNCFSIFESNNF